MTTSIRKVFVVKYCLSDGIYETEAEIDEDGKYARPVNNPGFQLFKMGRDAVESRSEAVKLAKLAAVKRVGSLNRQLTSMRRLEKTPKWRK